MWKEKLLQALRILLCVIWVLHYSPQKRVDRSAITQTVNIAVDNMLTTLQQRPSPSIITTCVRFVNDYYTTDTEINFADSQKKK